VCYTVQNMKLFSWLQDTHALENEDNSSETLAAPALAKRLQELSKVSVKEAMIPRALITALDADVQLKRVRRLKSAKVTYFPVYKGDLDHILGWIPKARVLELLVEPGEDSRLADKAKPAGVIHESASVAQLADAFLQSASPFLTVKNDLGTTVGIVPLTDFIELLFGFEIETATSAPLPDSSASRGHEI